MSAPTRRGRRDGGGGMQGKGEGICAFRFDATSGALKPAGITPGVRNPSFLTFDPERKFLFCVNELQEYAGAAGGAVSAYRIDPAPGALTHLNTRASHGTDPCHLAVERTGRNLIVANYSSGSVAVLPIGKDGALGEASCVIQHKASSVNPDRQAGPHAHCVTIDAANRYVLVCELGGDCVMIYELDAENGKLIPNASQPQVKTAPGAGPRHIAIHPNGRFAYLINELEFDHDGVRVRRGAGHARRDPDAVHVAGGLCRREQLRRNPDRAVRPVPLRLQSRSRQHRDLRARCRKRQDEPRRAREHARQDAAPLYVHARTGPSLSWPIRIPTTSSRSASSRTTGKLTATGDPVATGTPICVAFI